MSIADVWCVVIAACCAAQKFVYRRSPLTALLCIMYRLAWMYKTCSCMSGKTLGLENNYNMDKGYKHGVHLGVSIAVH